MYHPSPELLGALGSDTHVELPVPPETPKPPVEVPIPEALPEPETTTETIQVEAKPPAPAEPKASFWKNIGQRRSTVAPAAGTPETKHFEEKHAKTPDIPEKPDKMPDLTQKPPTEKPPEVSEKLPEMPPETRAPEEPVEKTTQSYVEEKDDLLAELAQRIPAKSSQSVQHAEAAQSLKVQAPSEPQPEPAQHEPAKPEEPAQEQAPKTGESEEQPKNALESDDELLAELVKLSPKSAPETSPTPARKIEAATEVQPETVTETQPVTETQSETPSDESVKNISETIDTVLDELGEKISINERIGAPKEFSEYCTFDLPPGYQELERYWITRPLVWVGVLYSPERNERMYYLVEPSLTPGEKSTLQMLHDHLLDRLVYDERIKDRDKLLQSKMNELLREYGIALTTKSLRKLHYYLKRNYIGYGKLDGIFRDPNIEDISCDGLNVPLFIYSRRYQSLRTNLVFTDTNELDLYTIRLVEKAGKQISLGKPTIDASLPEGYRLQATLGTEVTTRGSSFSIRKYAEEPFTPVDVLSYGTFSVEMLAYLWLCTENKKNLIIVGGTASGKTSTLNALSMFIWPDAKIVSIEDTRELALYQENWVPSIVKLGAGDRAIDMYELLRQALRQRPEVIIVGEVRGKEALTMFQAMSTGHTCYSTMHAGSIQEMVHRLEGEPINVPHHMLAAMDIVCLQLLTYYRDQRVRRNQSIVELAGIDPSTGSLRTNRIFERNPLTDEFERVGESNVLREVAKERGWSAIELERELRRRQEVLSFLLKNNVRRLHEVAAVFRQYYFEPDKVLEQLAAGKLKI